MRERIRHFQPTNAAIQLAMLRHEHGYGFLRLSKTSGVARTTLANFEYGATSSISANNLIKLAKVYGMTYPALRARIGLGVEDSIVRLNGAR